MDLYTQCLKETQILLVHLLWKFIEHLYCVGIYLFFIVVLVLCSFWLKIMCVGMFAHKLRHKIDHKTGHNTDMLDFKPGIAKSNRNKIQYVEKTINCTKVV